MTARLLVLVQISTLNAKTATLDQIKEVVGGDTDKINLKLHKLVANFEELCKTVKFLNDKYDELLP